MKSDRSYLGLNKILLIIVGLWPYQSKSSRILFRFIPFSCALANIIFNLRYLYKFWGDIDEMVNSVVFLFNIILGLIKLIQLFLSIPKMKQLFDYMDSDWIIWSRELEIRVLKKYSEQGRKLTLFYTIANYYSVVFYASFTLSSQILDFIVPLSNGTRVRKYAMPEDFGIDHEKYYYYIFASQTIRIGVNYTVTLAIDTIFAVYVQHVCGVFVAICHRLEGIMERISEHGDSKYSDHIAREISFCIERHNSAIKYAEKLEETFSTYMFLMTGLNMLSLSFSGVQVLVKLGNMDDVVKFGNYTLLMTIHLLFYSFPGQRLIDHSLMIFRSSYNSYWYEMPVSLQKKLILMMIRCYKPCQITAGNFYVISMEFFSKVVQTAVSYFTVFATLCK